MTKHDIAIIGAGPGGYVAAIRAAQLGAKVALIEAEEVGGVCLNRGCIPTKAIIASIIRLRGAETAAEMGILIDGGIKADLEAIISRKNNIVSGLVKGIHQLIKAGKIEYLKGRAAFGDDSLTLNISSTDHDTDHDGAISHINAANIIIATGSKWHSVPGLEPDGQNIVTSDDMLNLTKVPERLVILGGGVIGCEFASIFSALGSDVTIVEAMEEILPMEDPITSRALARALKKQGVKILTGTTISSSVVRRPSSVELKLSNSEELVADKLLVSIGRCPNFDGLGIENIGVEIKNGAIKTDEKMQTNIPGIHAVGDVNGKHMLAHVASEEGIVAVENIMGKKTSVDYSAIPRPVYTHPEVCCVGTTARQLAENGRKFKTGKSAFASIPKALCDGAKDGQAVIYADEKGGKILGAQIIGEHATEIVAELTLAIRNGLTISDLAHTIHSHPTLSEIIKEAAEDSEGHAIHKVYR